jgi:lipid-binding SYLF domain-containing protein
MKKWEIALWALPRSSSAGDYKIYMRNAVVTIFAVAALSPFAMAQKESHATDRLDASADVLRDMMHADDKGIPQDLMNKADCVVIVPNMKKAGFIFGAKYGRGFAVCRRTGGTGWTAPAGIRIEGGTFGLQIGGTEQDAVLLVMNERGMKHLRESKFTLGADATVAAGPVGRAATAQTDASLHAEMLSYSRARGIFAGLVLDGATLRPDDSANRELYGTDPGNRAILTGGVQTPPAAQKVESLLNHESLRETK